MRHKIQHEKASLTTPHVSMPPRLEIPPLSVRTTKSDFYVWYQNLGSCSIGLFKKQNKTKQTNKKQFSEFLRGQE